METIEYNLSMGVIKQARIIHKLKPDHVDLFVEFYNETIVIEEINKNELLNNNSKNKEEALIIAIKKLIAPDITKKIMQTLCLIFRMHQVSISETIDRDRGYIRRRFADMDWSLSDIEKLIKVLNDRIL